MYNVMFKDNTSFVSGGRSASVWIGLMKRDSSYWDWMYDWLIQASQHYDIKIDKSLIVFSDKD